MLVSMRLSLSHQSAIMCLNLIQGYFYVSDPYP